MTKPRPSFMPANECSRSFSTLTTPLGLAAVCLAVSSACAAPSGRSRLLDSGEDQPSAAGSGASVAQPPSIGAGGSGGSGPMLNLGGDFSGGGSGGLTGTGVPETMCDGQDENGNGIIDDVDAGHDGVCDCLNIATVGQIGPYSDGGNIFVSWLGARSPQGAVALEDQVLTPELLAPFQVVVFLHVDTTTVSWGTSTAAAHHAFSAAESDAFKSWVEAGGGAMTTIGYAADEAREVQNVNLLLNPVGLGYGTQPSDLSGYVQTWQPHPITAGISNIFTENGTQPQGSGTTVAFGWSDAVALQVAEVQNGRVVVWGDEWITYDSEWQDIEDQQVELFWLNILKWLSPPNECQVEIPPTVQ